MSAPLPIGLDAWRSMLRGVWDVEPSTRAALALVVLLHDLTTRVINLRDEVVLRKPELLIDREFGEATKAVEALLARVDVYADAVARAQRGDLDDAGLAAWVAVPILDGVWPSDFPMLHQIAGKGIYFDTVTGRTSSKDPPSYVGDAELAAYGYNKMIAGVESLDAPERSLLEAATGLSATFTEETIRGAIDDAEKTVSDASDVLLDALKAARDKVGDLLDEAWGIAKIVGGVLLGATALGLVIWIAKR